jgi:hypothetical protein
MFAYPQKKKKICMFAIPDVPAPFFPCMLIYLSPKFQVTNFSLEFVVEHVVFLSSIIAINILLHQD